MQCVGRCSRLAVLQAGRGPGRALTPPLRRPASPAEFGRTLAERKAARKGPPRAPSQPLSIAVVSTWPPTACGVASFAQNSMRALQQVLPAGSRLEVRGAHSIPPIPAAALPPPRPAPYPHPPHVATCRPPGQRGATAHRLPPSPPPLLPRQVFPLVPDGGIDVHSKDRLVARSIRRANLQDYMTAAQYINENKFDVVLMQVGTGGPVAGGCRAGKGAPPGLGGGCGCCASAPLQPCAAGRWGGVGWGAL
jgi:hypothetical protein